MKKTVIAQYLMAFLFTFCGGYCDAYTYLLRGGVFANMQTGNLVKLCVNIASGKFEVYFFLPMIFFCLGTIASAVLNRKKDRGNIILIIMFVINLAAALCPTTTTWNFVCICALSVAGAMQFQSFRQCCELTYTSTMCTNNMRLFSEGLVDFVADRKDKKVFFYFLIIVCFSLGCVVSALLGKVMNGYTIVLLPSIYAVIFILRVVFKEKAEQA